MSDMDFGRAMNPLPFDDGRSVTSVNEFLANSPIPVMPGTEVSRGTFSGTGAPKQPNVGVSRTDAFNAGSAPQYASRQTDSHGQPAQGNGGA